MKYIDADKLFAEIERQEEIARLDRVSEVTTRNQKIGADGKVKLCLELKCFLDTLEGDFDDVDPKHLVHQHINKCEAARRIAEWILSNPDKFNHGDIKEVTAEINALL